jgi:hypothetical protein
MSGVSDHDRRGMLAENFVREWALASGHLFIPAGDKTPSIDGQIQFRDPATGTNLYLQCQIKTGDSYVRDLRHNPRCIVIDLDRSDIENWRSSNVPVILIWVKEEAGRPAYALWADTRTARTNRSSLRMRRSSQLDASCAEGLLQLARAHAGRSSNVVLATVPATPLRALKQQMWEFFREWRSSGAISPVLGSVLITRHVWRHITRAELSPSAVAHRLSLLPCAREVIDRVGEFKFLRLIKTVKNIRIEFVALRARVAPSYRRATDIEVIVQIARRRKRILSARLYSVHEVVKINA